VLEQTGHPKIVETIARVVREMPDEAQRNDAKLIRALQRFVQENVRFVREYPERYQAPARTLEWGIGDCDDQAPLMACLARTCKIPSRLCIGGWGETAEDAPIWRHIYAQVLIPVEGRERWVSSETVRRAPLGFDATDWMGSKGFRTARTFVGDNGPL
jgi:transglutaminase-like putative cysteine protease